MKKSIFTVFVPVESQEQINFTQATEAEFIELLKEYKK